MPRFDISRKSVKARPDQIMEGSVFWYEGDERPFGEPGGRRPVVLLGPDLLNRVKKNNGVLGLPLTTAPTRASRDLDTAVFTTVRGFTRRVIMDGLRTMNPDNLCDFEGVVGPPDMRRIKAGLADHLKPLAKEEQQPTGRLRPGVVLIMLGKKMQTDIPHAIISSMKDPFDNLLLMALDGSGHVKSASRSRTKDMKPVMQLAESQLASLRAAAGASMGLPGFQINAVR